MPGPALRFGTPGAGDRRIEIDDERDEYAAARGCAGGIWSVADVRSRLEACVQEWLADAVERDAPGLLEGDESLDSVIAKIQEDVVIMHRDDGAPAVSARAVYLNVAFPSGWCPPCTSGKSFVAIHAPVPNIGEFDGTGRKAGAELLFQNDDAVRFVWSLTPDAALDRRRCHRKAGGSAPHESVSASWEPARRLYLRVERQVIAGIDANTACFFIRVYRYALEALEADVRARIHESIATMPESIRAYKGIADAWPRLLSLIRRDAF
jgi:hypothetical protein